MKVKISLTFADEHCENLLNEFGLETAEELKVALKMCFGEAIKDLAEGGRRAQSRAENVLWRGYQRPRGGRAASSKSRVEE